MSNYTKATNFAAKDSLAAGNPNKIVKGTEIDSEFTAIATAIATKADATSVTVPASFKNKVRNSKIDIAQRGTSFTGLGNTSSYTLDGWLWAGSGIGAVVTVSQQADVASNSECQNSLRVTATTADTSVTASKLAHIVQLIEGYLVRDLLGNPIALRFEVKSPKSGIHCVAIRNGASDRSYVAEYTVTSANTWQTVTIPLAATGIPSSGTWNFTTGTGLVLSFPLMAGSTYQTTPGAWQTGNFVATSNQQNLLDTVSNVFAVTGVQLEKATASTALEHKDAASELVLNQRYYEIGFVRCESYSVGGGNYGQTVSYKVTKRATPTVTPSMGYSNASGASIDGASDTSGFMIRSTVTSTGTAAFAGTWTASCEL